MQKVTVLYGDLKLNPEFIWVGRKTLRKFWYNQFEYFVCTPYLKIGANSYDEAWLIKFKLEHHV